jgi:hypothetical protein
MVNQSPNRGHALQRAPFFLYFAVIVTLAGCVVYFGWVRTWSSLYLPAMYPPFADMRMIQGAVISVEHGYDPRIANLGDPWGRSFDYPMLWVAIGKALNFTDERWFMTICAISVLCFIVLCAILIFRYPSFGLLASLVSTSTLLGVERGNIDLLVFCLLACTILWIPRRWSLIPLSLATLLKLYPVFALSALFIRRQFLLFAASLAAAFMIFAYLWDQLAYIGSWPVGCEIYYGIPGVSRCFARFGWPSWQFAVLFAAIGLAILALACSFSRSDAVRPKQDVTFDLMLVGAAIYVGTFMFAGNVDYRLIFLILCIPFLQSRPFPYARAVMVVMVAAMNAVLLISWFAMPGLIVVELAKIVIFAVLSAYLFALTRATLLRVASSAVTVAAPS